MKKAGHHTISLLTGDLLDAVIANDVTQVEKLLSQQADPNCYEDHCEIRPLHFAAVYNSVNVIFPLVKAGAKINAKTADGYKPIDIAKQLKHYKIADILSTLSINLIPIDG